MTKTLSPIREPSDAGRSTGDFELLLLAESIRSTEEQTGFLEDGEANRLARVRGGDLRARILCRAHFLAQRDGLCEALGALRQGAFWSLVVLAICMLAGGWTLARGILGDGTAQVSLMSALGLLLGVHGLTLLGWCWVMMFYKGRAGLGRVWLWLAKKFAHHRGIQLIPVLTQWLERERLVRWGFGMVTHVLWVLFLSAAFFALCYFFTVRRYGFIWETTLLSNDSLALLAGFFGSLPALLGCPLPDTETIRAASELAPMTDTHRQLWARWLIGVLLVWGVIPRLLLALFCFWRWRRGYKQLDLDLTLPGYSLLHERLLPGSERLGINDPAPELPAPESYAPAIAHGGNCWLAAIELDDSRSWPPPLPDGILDAGIIDDSKDRRLLLERFAQCIPLRLVIACDPRRSPDRGTLAFLGELSRSAHAVRVWLLPAPIGQTIDSDRLSDWQQALDTAGLPYAFGDDGAVLDWLERGND